MLEAIGVSDLTLVLTERCNLSCSFCYVPKRGRQMPLSLARRAVDWLVDNRPRGSRPSVGFFGGEPLLALDLLERVVAHGRERAGDAIRFTLTTNGRLVDTPTARRLERAGVELALSVDDATATGTSQHGLEPLRPALDQLRRFSPIVRMTVTPDNVGNLLATVVRLFEAGFSRIMHQPALESPWPAAAVEVWQAQHEALADWACERASRRAPLPHLTVLEGIIGRLGGGAPGYCRAGLRTAAVDPEGRVFGCFRSVYDPRAERMVLANLNDGWINEPLLRVYAGLHPHRARPQQGSCRSCPARDGCTVFCPAMGHVLLGDLRGVPADACRLMAIQVEVCRELARRTRRIQRRRRVGVGARVAAAALALGLAGGSAACDDGRPVGSDATVDGPPPGLCPMDSGPGLCPPDGMLPGLCPVPVPDLTPPGLCDAPWLPDMMGPGLCPPPDGPVPGVCPVAPDSMVPGLCPAPVDGSIPGPGICPVPPPDGMAPGLC